MLTLLLVKKLLKYFQKLKEFFIFVIPALTHMRWKNDEKLAKKVHGVDLILGGTMRQQNISLFVFTEKF